MKDVSARAACLSVHADDSDWVSRAKDVLQNTGAQDVSSTGEAGADYNKTDKPMPRSEREIDNITDRPRTKTGGGYDV